MQDWTIGRPTVFLQFSSACSFVSALLCPEPVNTKIKAAAAIPVLRDDISAYPNADLREA
jgi:hypothetical protein